MGITKNVLPALIAGGSVSSASAQVGAGTNVPTLETLLFGFLGGPIIALLAFNALLPRVWKGSLVTAKTRRHGYGSSSLFSCWSGTSESGAPSAPEHP